MAPLAPLPFLSLRDFWNFNLSARAMSLKDGVCVRVCGCVAVCLPPLPLSLLLQLLHGLCSRSADSFVLCEMTFIVFLQLQTEYMFAVEKVGKKKKQKARAEEDNIKCQGVHLPVRRDQVTLGCLTTFFVPLTYAPLLKHWDPGLGGLLCLESRSV